MSTLHDASVPKKILDPVVVESSVNAVSPWSIEVDDPLGVLRLNDRVEVETDVGALLGEVGRLHGAVADILPFANPKGVRRGGKVRFLSSGHGMRPSSAWRGRVIDGLARPIDGKGPLSMGECAVDLRQAPPAAPLRARLGAPIDFGVKALNAFTPALQGQRLGVFSGAGVGKSALLGEIARHAECDCAVIALIGERGREVREFIEDQLGEEGLERAVVIVATSDQSALMRREAAHLALAVSEYFRDRGEHVLCLMDSLTRVAMAQREIGLAAGEPPATRGYPPSVFSGLPALVERAGPGADIDRAGFITGVFSIFVEGDDHDEPIADAARAILDGHIVLDRAIAARGRFPAINVSRSLSRGASKIYAPDEAAMVSSIRTLLAAYEESRELIRIGAYQQGTNQEADRAIALYPALEEFLAQEGSRRVSREETMAALRALVEHKSDP